MDIGQGTISTSNAPSKPSNEHINKSSNDTTKDGEHNPSTNHPFLPTRLSIQDTSTTTPYRTVADIFSQGGGDLTAQTTPQSDGCGTQEYVEAKDFGFGHKGSVSEQQTTGLLYIGGQFAYHKDPPIYYETELQIEDFDSGAGAAPTAKKD